MSESTGRAASIRWRRGATGLALTFILAGCTGSGTPTGTPEAAAGEQAPAAGPTGSSPSGTSGDPTAAEVDLEPGLYRVDPRTGEVELLLSGALAREPESSPDGSRLVYQGIAQEGTTQIFVLEEGESRQLTHLPGGAAEPTWSPDGSQITFAGSMSKGRDSDIFVMQADGSSMRPVARTDEYDRRPDWSPDGSRIVFDTYGGIWVASVADGHVTRIPIRTPQGYSVAPIWSPNGRWIAVTGYDGHPINGIVHVTRLWVWRPDGTDRRPLEKGKPDFYDSQLEATWSPDGTSIAFLGGEGREALTSLELGIIDVGTGKVVYISAAPRVVDLSWNAEGFILASVAEDASPSPPIVGITGIHTLRQDPWPGVG